MRKLVLLGNPKTTNRLYRRHGHIMYMSRDGKELKESYQWQAKSQWKLPILTGDLHIIIRIFFGTKRKADWDNFHKLSMDALSGIVWEDDSQIQIATVIKDYDKLNPRIEIDIL